MEIYRNASIYIEIHESEIPWLKIFTTEKYREFSEADGDTRLEILKVLDIIEKELLAYYKPTKINIASFGNYLPHLHFHIMARFESDSYFPEPMWGVKQREAQLDLPSFDIFIENLSKKLISQ